MRIPRWATVALAALSTAMAPVAAESPARAQAAPAGDHVQALGAAAHHGSLDTLAAAGHPVPDAGITTLVPTPTGGGYWLTLAEGSVYSFGDAGFFGSLGTLRAAGTAIPATVVISAAHSTPSGLGYWLVDQAGGVYSFGDAGFFGSVPALRAAGANVGEAPIVAMAATPSGLGYWLVDEVGGVVTLGDAPFHGSASGSLTEPIVGFAPGQGGVGYRLLAADGTVLRFGAVGDHGSATIPAALAAVAIAPLPSGDGYWVVMPHARPAGNAPPLPPASGEGRRVVYSNSGQRVWLVEANGTVSASWPVSGRRGVPRPGSYRVFSKSTSSVDASGSLVLRHMVRFAHGRRLAIGFHAIPTRRGRPIQGEDELGQYRSAGCVRQAPSDAAHLFAWAPVGTPVVVTP